MCTLTHLTICGRRSALALSSLAGRLRSERPSCWSRSGHERPRPGQGAETDCFERRDECSHHHLPQLAGLAGGTLGARLSPSSQLGATPIQVRRCPPIVVPARRQRWRQSLAADLSSTQGYWAPDRRKARTRRTERMPVQKKLCLACNRVLRLRVDLLIMQLSKAPAPKHQARTSSRPSICAPSFRDIPASHSSPAPGT